MKKFLPIIGLVILLTLFVAPAASAAPPAWGPDCGGAPHCVGDGETLYSIGRMYDKDPYYIAHANGLRNPNHIYAGQVLYIPADGPGYPWGGQGCYGYDCGYKKPVHYPSRGYDGGYPGRGYDRGYCDGCDYKQGYGYDYTGYYYEGYYPQYKRYSYTCGYNNNCY